MSKKSGAVLALSAVLSLAPVLAAADASRGGGIEDADTTPGAGAMAADVLLARPLGLAATLLGVGVFAISLPFAIVSGDVSGPARRLVSEPAQFTFTRPLGELQ